MNGKAAKEFHSFGFARPGPGAGFRAGSEAPTVAAQGASGFPARPPALPENSEYLRGGAAAGIFHSYTM